MMQIAETALLPFQKTAGNENANRKEQTGFPIHLEEETPPLPVSSSVPIAESSDLFLSIDQAKQRIHLLQEFIQSMMKEGVDYGKIPNTEKRCLFKSGAEKLCDIFGFTKRLEILHQIEDFDQGLFHYEVKAILINKRNGMIEAEGVGCCNSKEKKYRNQDGYSVANTVLKMAKKRAFVDAVLSATRSSDIFTQDMEDSAGIPEEAEKNAALKSGKKNAMPKGKGAAPGKRQETIQNPEEPKEAQEKASKRQISYIFTLLSQKKITVEAARTEMMQRYQVEESGELSKKQASDYIRYLNESGA